MGSSASIAAHATLNATKTRKPKITFHYEKPMEHKQIEEELVETMECQPAQELSLMECFTHQPAQETTQSPGKTTSPVDQLDAAVTRYFPLVKPPLLDVPPPLASATPLAVLKQKPTSRSPPSLPLLSAEQKEKNTKENYYYMCAVCSKGFMFKGSLTRHMARHSGVVTTTPSPTDETKPVVTAVSPSGTSEIRYQLKDPRLYEHQQAKVSSGGNTRKAPPAARAFRNRPTPTLAPVPLKTQPTQPTPRTKIPRSKCRSEIVLGKTTSPVDQLDAAVTRYFPLVKPPLLDVPPPLASATPLAVLKQKPTSRSPPSLPLLSAEQKEKNTKENYYYMCAVCSKGFMFKGSLTRHMARHSGVVTTTPSPTDETKPVVTAVSPSGTSEIRYQLKDPRLYEHQQAKVSSGGNTRKAPPAARAFRNRPTPTLAPVPLKTQPTQPTPRSSAPVPRSKCRSEIVLGKNVLAICSCLKCNSSFDDVDKLKEHIQRCQGYNVSTATRRSRSAGSGNNVLHKECNVSRNHSLSKTFSCQLSEQKPLSLIILYNNFTLGLGPHHNYTVHTFFAIKNGSNGPTINISATNE
eukprot:sb/3463380/